MRAAVTETHRELALPGGRLRYTLRRSARARTLRVTIHPERGVVVSIPPASRRGWAHAEPHVERFLGEREGWIRRHLARHDDAREAHRSRPALGRGRSIPYLGADHLVHFAPTDERTRRGRVRQADGELVIELSPSDGRPPASVLEAWLRVRAREAIDAAILQHAPALGVTPAAVTLRDPRSRWGSCSRKGRISLSWRLILAPPEALESVVVHELCHLKVFGHGPRFRALLASRIPDHATWRRWLHVHATELHGALEPSGAAQAA
jgi:predicted metal-dependent hydrolase